MLEKPDLDEERLITHLRTTFGLPVVTVDFLPLGADANTAVYRAATGDGTPYFVKLRAGAFDEMAVTLPAYLRSQGMAEVIAPLPGRDGRAFARLGAYAVIVYPFVAGDNGYAVALSDSQWTAFGRAIQRLHTLPLPPNLLYRLPRIAYTPRWRDAVRQALRRAATDSFADPLAAELAAFLCAHHDVTLDLVERAARHAEAIQAQPRDLVLCHTDLHAGNLHITAGGDLFIVDWDNPTLAPKERDLMFIGGAQGFAGRTAAEEIDRFYAGYGPVEIDSVALAYFRYERILEDIAIYCDDIWSSDDGGEDRRQAMVYLASNYTGDGTIATAIAAERDCCGQQSTEERINPMSNDAAEWFRTRLSDDLRAAFAARDRAAIRTLRCIMAAIDNAGAVAVDASAMHPASPTEAPRRPLNEAEIAAILQAEIAARARVADEYERRGNAAQAGELRHEIATIQPLVALLP